MVVFTRHRKKAALTILRALKKNAGRKTRTAYVEARDYHRMYGRIKYRTPVTIRKLDTETWAEYCYRVEQERIARAANARMNRKINAIAKADGTAQRLIPPPIPNGHNPRVQHLRGEHKDCLKFVKGMEALKRHTRKQNISYGGFVYSDIENQYHRLSRLNLPLYHIRQSMGAVIGVRNFNNWYKIYQARKKVPTRKRNTAATKLQSAWRGYTARNPRIGTMYDAEVGGTLQGGTYYNIARYRRRGAIPATRTAGAA